MTERRSLHHLVQTRHARAVRSWATPARRPFGRAQRVAAPAIPAAVPATTLVDDLKLFATTFAGGFLFVAIYFG